MLKKGFTEAPLRAIIFAQLTLSGLSLLAGLFMLWTSAWFICFFIGTALVSFNFWSMSSFLLKVLPGGFSGKLLHVQLCRFFGRILLTGLVLAGALLLGGSPWALFLGLFSGLALTGCVGFARTGGSGY